jgi:hypothetical protein
MPAVVGCGAARQVLVVAHVFRSAGLSRLSKSHFWDHALLFADDGFFSRMPFLCFRTNEADWPLRSFDPGAFP